VFPGNREGLHPLFTLTAFVSAGFAALLTATIQTVPFRYASRLLGVVILAALAVGMVGEGCSTSWVTAASSDGLLIRHCSGSWRSVVSRRPQAEANS
jgi:hypothetical protein